MKIHGVEWLAKVVFAARVALTNGRGLAGAGVAAAIFFGADGWQPRARAAGAPEAEAREILQAAGVRGGVVVHLGAGDGKLTAGLRASPSFQVLGLMFDAAQVPAAREAIQQLGVYGPVSVEFLDGRELPFIDNLVNLLVAEDLRGVAMSEVLRVLVPDGVALAPGTMSARPKNPLLLGAEANVADEATGTFSGSLDVVAVHQRALNAEEIQRHADNPAGVKPDKDVVLFCSFDKADARDESESRAHGVMSGVQSGKGKVNAGLVFRAPKPANALTAKLPAPRGGAGIFVQQNWHRYVPVVTRAMAMAGKTIFLSGPPDMVDEEYAFERLTQKDKSILPLLAKQDAALDGKGGGRLFAVSTENGGQNAEIDLESPPVWDGMAVAQGRLYIADMDGVVRCHGRAKE